tara:strand:+ start:680 stop:835 length:156 start_codon:yes stop_codon:yes gene_type:complete
MGLADFLFFGYHVFGFVMGCYLVENGLLGEAPYGWWLFFILWALYIFTNFF